MNKIFKLIKEGEIHLGMTKADLRELLGPPEDWSLPTGKYKEPSIWKYSGLEFWWEIKKYRTPYPGPKLISVYYDTERHDGEHRKLLGN